MPRRRVPSTSRRKETAGPDMEDRLSALPDEALQHVLSFARRWRDLWKSTPALFITETVERWENPEDTIEFVNHLLLLRDRSPLDICELNLYQDYTTDDEIDRPFRYIQLWIRYALAHKARVLRVLTFNIIGDSETVHFDLDRARLVSRHLTVLELHTVRLDERALDLATCPSLKVLEMTHCIILAREITSQSLRHLIATDSSFDESSRTLISAPSLVSLQLKVIWDRTPALQSMPLLATALVELDDNCHDYCPYSSGKFDNDSCKCHDCRCCPDDSDRFVLLRGLSNATDLKLLAGRSVVPEHLVEMEGSQNPAEQFTHLKTVEVACRDVEERVQKFLKCLISHGVPADVIKIKK